MYFLSLSLKLRSKIKDALVFLSKDSVARGLKLDAQVQIQVHEAR